ncbi:DUF2971 domain-containing protein [Blastopirellula marina]|uniref:DUF2971 domain-containing protein n=1 Tax=Blastopirellula marina TaxID=124 RepID=A0A2S8GD98_9BACT|nr:DUF2971 domain-containing protein [Blastopirellula marina]PQO42435.1 hypothetical protein C5Y93_29350 [Blastopirellula marina]
MEENNAITLYKYRAINDWSLDTLRTGRMWFSLPNKLNDTFEFSVPVYIRLTPKEVVEHFAKRFNPEYFAPVLLEAMMEHGRGDSFPATDEYLLEFFNSTSAENRALVFISLIHFYQEKGLTIDDIVETLALDSNAELFERIETDLRNAYNRNLEAGEYFGVLSLSARNDDPLMWAHYGDSCKGMCIGITFDIDKLVESDLIPLWVDYREELPVLCPDEFFERERAATLNMIKIFYATKHLCWKHEAELRLVSRIGDVALEIPGKITEVILGEKASDTDLKRVFAVIKEQSDTQFRRMMREPGTWNYRAFRYQF